MSVGMSNAVERPVCPCSRRYRKRSFVSSAVPKPANWRIVQRRPRYIVGWTPRVNGKCAGAAEVALVVDLAFSGDRAARSRPEIVENSSPSRSGVAS